MQNIQSTFQLTGLHCPSCQKITEKRVGKIAGVTGAQTNLETGKLIIQADRQVAAAEVSAVLIGTDYQVS